MTTKELTQILSNLSKNPSFLRRMLFQNHMSEHHEMSDADLVKRVVKTEGKTFKIAGASTFETKEKADAVLIHSLEMNAEKIAEWVCEKKIPNSHNEDKEVVRNKICFTTDMTEEDIPKFKKGEPIGKMCDSNLEFHPASVSNLVIIRDPNSYFGFNVRSLYASCSPDDIATGYPADGHDILHKLEDYKNATPIEKLYMDTVIHSERLDTSYNSKLDRMYLIIRDKSKYGEHYEQHITITADTHRDQFVTRHGYIPYKDAKPTFEKTIPEYAKPTLKKILIRKEALGFNVNYNIFFDKEVDKSKLKKDYPREFKEIEAIRAKRDEIFDNLDYP